MNRAVWIVLGVGVGAVLGVATDNVGSGIAIGAVIGRAISAVLDAA